MLVLWIFHLFLSSDMFCVMNGWRHRFDGLTVHCVQFEL